MHQKKRIGPAVLSALALVLITPAACDLAYIPIGFPFSKIEYDQRDRCVDPSLPAYIAVINQNDGTYLLELTEFDQVEIQIDSGEYQNCLDMGGIPRGGICFLQGDSTFRALTSEEMQLVDQVLAELVQVDSLVLESDPCPDPACSGFTTINGMFFSPGHPCTTHIASRLSSESRERLRELWILLHN